MDFLEKLNMLMYRDGYNKNSLSKACGIPYTTIDNWFKRGYDGLQLSTLKKLNGFFHTTLEFWSRDDVEDPDFGKSIGFELTSAELSHIKKYRSLDGHGKKIVDMVLNEESERMKNIPRILPPLERIISLDDYLTPVSAGTGEIALEDSPKEQIKVIDNAYTRKANFVVRVKGDSMIPRYFDGDKLLIQSAGIPNFGEIGIWCVDGQTYVKQSAGRGFKSVNQLQFKKSRKSRHNAVCGIFYCIFYCIKIH